MKSFKFLILLLISNTSVLYSQIENNKAKHRSIAFEIGHSTSVFLNSNPAYSKKSNNPIYSPTFYKLSYGFNKNFNVFVNYKNYSEFYLNYNVAEILIRNYHAFDIGISNTYPLFNKKIKLQPSFLLSTRPSGTENVVIAENEQGWPHTNNYSYKSCGFGFGLNISKSIFKQFLISFETQYNYYFESKKLRGRSISGYEDVEKAYKVNRHMITPIFKIGYQFDFK